jgi:hypothetical protein
MQNKKDVIFTKKKNLEKNRISSYRSYHKEILFLYRVENRCVKANEKNGSYPKKKA